jgi:hypothetical protein
MWLHRPHILLSLRVAWTPQMGLLLYNHFVHNFGDMELSYYGYYYCCFIFNYGAVSISVYTQPNNICNNLSKCEGRDRDLM